MVINVFRIVFKVYFVLILYVECLFDKKSFILIFLYVVLVLIFRVSRRKLNKILSRFLCLFFCMRVIGRRICF